MSLYDQLKNDSKMILTRKNGITAPITITNEKGENLEIRGRWTDIGVVIDQETGLPIAGRSYTIAFFIEDVETIYNNNNYKNWVVSFTNNKGEIVTGEIVKPLINRTLGYISSHMVARQ